MWPVRHISRSEIKDPKQRSPRLVPEHASACTKNCSMCPYLNIWIQMIMFLKLKSGHKIHYSLFGLSYERKGWIWKSLRTSKSEKFLIKDHRKMSISTFEHIAVNFPFRSSIAASFVASNIYWLNHIGTLSVKINVVGHGKSYIAYVWFKYLIL